MPDAPDGSRLPLVDALLSALEARGIRWCHWKSTIRLPASARGETDLDLLVAPEDQPALLETLGALGFREADPPPEKAAAATRSYFGFDPQASRPIHAHVHYRLMVGHDLSKGYRLPVEDALLATRGWQDGFRVPAPGLELAVFVVRMLLKHGCLDVLLLGRGTLRRRDREELSWLEARADESELRRTLSAVGPVLDVETWRRVRAALAEDASSWRRWREAHRLRRRLAALSPESPRADAWRRVGRAIAYRARRARTGGAPRHTPTGGGLVVALVGADGSGKSTALDALEAWLSRDLQVVRVHLGRPRWSPLTVGVRGGLKVGRTLARPLRGRRAEAPGPDDDRPPGLSEIAKHVLTARDRRRVYRRAARAAARGGVVLCDRYPLPQLSVMDGPQIRRRLGTNGAGTGSLARAAMRLEEHLYAPMAEPDLLFVLQVPAEVSRRRKPEENPAKVEERAREILDTDWRSTRAIVLDATRPADEVAGELKRRLWQRL